MSPQNYRHPGNSAAGGMGASFWDSGKHLGPGLDVSPNPLGSGIDFDTNTSKVKSLALGGSCFSLGHLKQLFYGRGGNTGPTLLSI